MFLFCEARADIASAIEKNNHIVIVTSSAG